MDKIPEQFRKAIGTPLVAFYYGHPISTTFHNVAEYAHMSAAKIDQIRHGTCGCQYVAAKFKPAGYDHVLTSSPEVFPSEKLKQLAIAMMGAKYRPSSCSNVYDANTRFEILSAIEHGVQQFADRAERRTGVPGCMGLWRRVTNGRTG